MQSARNVTRSAHSRLIQTVLAVLFWAPFPTHGEPSFEDRAQFFIRQTAALDVLEMKAYFERTPYFQNGSGDPHKYALPPIMARLYLDPDDEEALTLYRFLMQSDVLKPDRGLYHFSIFQKTRLFMQLGDRLPPDAVSAMDHDVRHFFHVMVGERASHPWTENHNFMQRCSAYLWAESLSRDGAPHPDLAFLRRWLIDEAKKFYTVGMGEYDSSTYLGFSAASWTNVYDFAQDEEMRLIAKAALDWLATALARKYYHGLQLGPESRGFAPVPVGQVTGKPSQAGAGNMKLKSEGTHSDWCGWLWWGDTAGQMHFDRRDGQVDRFPALNLAMSSYRPPEVVTRLARKQVTLPYEVVGSKPSYYRKRANQDQETLFVSENFAMGTLYSGQKGIRTSGTILPQTTMFKLLVRDSSGVHSFGIGQGYHKHYPIEGRGPFDQYHQKKGTVICLTAIGDSADVAPDLKQTPFGRMDGRAILGVPAGVGNPVERNGWFGWKIGTTAVGAFPLGDPATFEDLPERSGKRDDHRWLVSRGRRSGWIVQASDQYGSLNAFLDDLQGRVERGSKSGPWEVGFRSTNGDTLRVRHTGIGRRPEAWTNGQKLSYEDWPVYQSPYVRQQTGSGILEVSDGSSVLTIDFSGDRPVYREQHR